MLACAQAGTFGPHMGHYVNDDASQRALYEAHARALLRYLTVIMPHRP